MWRGDIFVIKITVFCFYDVHSKTIMKKCFRIWHGGISVIIKNLNYDGFEGGTAFVLVPYWPFLFSFISQPLHPPPHPTPFLQTLKRVSLPFSVTHTTPPHTSETPPPVVQPLMLSQHHQPLRTEARVSKLASETTISPSCLNTRHLIGCCIRFSNSDCHICEHTHITSFLFFFHLYRGQNRCRLWCNDVWTPHSQGRYHWVLFSSYHTMYLSSTISIYLNILFYDFFHFAVLISFSQVKHVLIHGLKKRLDISTLSWLQFYYHQLSWIFGEFSSFVTWFRKINFIICSTYWYYGCVRVNNLIKYHGSV